MNGCEKDEIWSYIVENYCPFDFSTDEIRPMYRFDVSAAGSTLQALEAFFESIGLRGCNTYGCVNWRRQ